MQAIASSRPTPPRADLLDHSRARHRLGLDDTDGKVVVVNALNNRHCRRVRGVCADWSGALRRRGRKIYVTVPSAADAIIVI
jgi:hypothetical protein